MGDINFRAITWHGLLWQQKGNYICNQRQEWKKNNFFTPYVLNHNSNTIFCSWNCLDLVSLTKRNIAMMSKPKKTCWVKKLVVSSKEKRQIIIIKVFIPQVILLLTYFLVSYTDVRFLWMSCAVKDIIKLDIYILGNNTLIIRIRYYFVYYILKITNKYHTSIRQQYCRT